MSASLFTLDATMVFVDELDRLEALVSAKTAIWMRRCVAARLCQHAMPYDDFHGAFV